LRDAEWRLSARSARGEIRGVAHSR
jgi:hypothetical protein